VPEIQLRDYQQRDVDALRAQYALGMLGVLFVLPTGGGKTFVFSYIAMNAAAKGTRVLILVHRQELLRQSSDSLYELGVDHGQIAPKRSMTYDTVQVASVQTAVRRLDKIQKPGLIIVDEAHHAAAGSWRKIIEHFPDTPVLGVTATPCRLDGKGLGRSAGGYFDVMVQGPAIKELIKAGFLSKPKVYAPPTDLVLDDVKTRMGDYAKDELAKAVDKPMITGSAVEHYGRLCPGKPAIAFCVSVAHAEHVAADFRAAGFKAQAIDGSMDDGTRKGLITSLARGKLDVLCSCEIVSEGTDIPVVTAAILLRPTQSLSLYLQQVGRALRPYPGKKHALILDHVGNCMRHGLPQDDREWSLDGDQRRGKKGKRQEIVARVQQCPECYAVHAPMPRCNQCGYEYKPSEIIPEQADGELEEISPEELKRIKKDRNRRIGTARTLDELKQVAKELGYKPGWAWHQWQNRKKRNGTGAKRPGLFTS